MEEDNRNAYSEVLEILKLVDDEKKLEALPIEMLEVLKSKANPEYKPKILKEVPLEEQNLLPETFSILSWIAVKYWKELINSEEKNISNFEQEIKGEESNVSNFEKEIINNEEVKEPYEQIDENVKEEITENTDTSSTLPILYKDLKWYQKIKVKMIEWFNRIFKREPKEEGMKNEEEGSTI